jgi:hypothetical protein
MILVAIESNGNNLAVGDNGRAIGCLQIHEIFVDDVNRILKRNVFTYADRKDRNKSIRMAIVYLRHYGNVYQKRTGKEPSIEVLVRMFNGGPRGYEKSKTNKYYKRFTHERFLRDSKRRQERDTRTDKKAVS